MQLLLLVIMFIQVNLCSVKCHIPYCVDKEYEEVVIATYKEVFR